MLANEAQVKPPKSFYDLEVRLNNGSILKMDSLRGKKVMLVNTASECGYTPQYDALQKLYENYEDRLVIIGFPANDFGHQEKGSDESIAEFCKINFGVSFPLAKKSQVIKTADQNPVFKWLSNKSTNGWNDQAPTWNFSKYLVDENGILRNYFEPGISPTDNVIKKALEK
jgi:glutathione peroxidase